MSRGAAGEGAGSGGETLDAGVEIDASPRDVRGEAEALLYLYGVVPDDAAAPPAELPGIDGGVVRVVPLGAAGALVSEVDAHSYREEALERSMTGLEWVGARGVAHERVLTWYAERGPVVPLALFSLHRDEERLKGRLGPRAEALAALLESLRGKAEWSVRLRRRSGEARAWIRSEAPELEVLRQEIAAAAPGRRFLLEKKRDSTEEKVLMELTAGVAREVHEALAALADRSEVDPVPTPAGGEDGASRLILDAAFLVPDGVFEDFRTRVGELAGRFGGSGFDFELAGPLPPYHFATLP